MGIETAAVAAPKAAEAAGASKGAEGAGLLGGGKGAEAAGAGLAGGTDLLSGGFATAADLTAGGATGLAEGTGFATAADLAGPAALGTGAAIGFTPGATAFGPPVNGFTEAGQALGSTGGLNAFAQAPGGGGNVLPGAGTDTFGAPSSGVLTPGATGGTAGTGAVTPPVGVGATPLSIDPTATAGDAAASGATGSAGVAGNVAAPAAASKGFSLESLLSGAGKSIMANPLGTAIAAGGLGYSMLQGQQVSAAQKKLEEEAAQLDGQGQKLASYLLNGNLPDGLKQSLDQATASAKARVRSNFAAQGLSTDPTKNSALAAELQMIDTQAVITTAQIGQQLLSAGQAATGLSSHVYETLANLDQTQTQRIGAAVANMAQALSPSRGLTVNLGGK